MVENLGCFLRITEEVFVWMILDAGFEMNELIISDICTFDHIKQMS